jgi:hypothetical protein
LPIDYSKYLRFCKEKKVIFLVDACVSGNFMIGLEKCHFLLGGIIMSDFSKFRSSLNGFNRSDVVAYIETLCAIPHLTGINLSQPELNDMERIYRCTVDKGIKLLGFAREYAQKSKNRPGELHHNVHC